MTKTFTVRLNNDEAFIEDYANFKGVTVAKLLKDITIEHIEDLIDIQSAEEQLAKINSGKEKIITWEEFLSE